MSIDETYGEKLSSERVLKNTAHFFQTKSDYNPNAVTRTYVEGMYLVQSKTEK